MGLSLGTSAILWGILSSVSLLIGVIVGKIMCNHSQEEAKKLGFGSTQFNLMVSTNESAIHLWKKLGFQVIGELPDAFQHKKLGYVDALVMYKKLK